MAKITWPNSLNSIGPRAFQNTALSKVVLPNSINVISNSAFYNCSKPEEVWLPQGIDSIVSMTFGHCESLNRIHIPDNVTTIENNAFYNSDSTEGRTVYCNAYSTAYDFALKHNFKIVLNKK